MTDHWALSYVGKPWTPQQDCFYWFRYWSRTFFGHDLPDSGVCHERLLATASRIMAGDIERAFGYRLTETPQEGDAVFLSQRTRPHHIGMVVLPDEQFYVLHALEGAGVIASTVTDLALNGWKIKGYWTYAG